MENLKEEGAEQKQIGDDCLLMDDISVLFSGFFGEVLNILSSRFPHIKGDGSSNELEFKGIRAKILRSGNNKVRELPKVVSKYQVVKMFETIVEEKEINMPYKTRGE